MKIIRNSTFILIGLIFISWSDDNCKKGFGGKWKYKRFSEEAIYVVRTLEKQYEYVDNGKYYYEFKIKWLDNCRYQLTYLGTTSPNPSPAYIGETFVVEILKMDTKHMEYKTTFRNVVDSDEMIKIQ